ncbi:hypothetical protein ATANTOWER_018206 [Ataeniobius toweri]|uniref:Phospholipase A2-like central domain-containing protein n=1 Tax=Ataeniobius toweri TaxID=208326 RepID=A0ABU7B267_9TELE|nr:hypothetical protein [Ataeniobius toweri]
MWSVFFVFLSYLDRNVVRGDFLSRALDAEKESKEMLSMINGTFCAKMSFIGENVLYQVSDGAEVVRTVVSPAGKVVNCSVVVNQMEVKLFMHECRLGQKEGRAGQQLEARFARMDEATLMCREFKEKSERSSEDSSVGLENAGGGEEKVLQRSKRGFTYPGTLWCGAGNMADDYNQLGEFADTDSCCRIHDHCPHVIHAFSSKYGHTNFKWHSICHCDCDNELKACLRKVNDTSSRVVGQAFFNVIGVPCFDFAYEEQCAERHWYGLCKRYEKFPIAVLREAVPYDYGGIDVIDELTLAPPKRKESKKSNEEEQGESLTQSMILEPSLRNVVTATEDFIKVLATVSTSQSSDKEETQTSDKKKRKNTGKKKKMNKKHKEKGKGRKRNQKAEAGVKAEEGAVVPPPGSKSEDVLPLNNFISESNKHDRSNINANRVDDSKFELRRTDEPSNEVMKDEPATDKDTVSITSPLKVQKMLAESEIEEVKEEVPLSAGLTTVTSHKTKNRGQRKGGRKRSKKTSPPSSPKYLRLNSIDSVTTIIDILPTTEPEQHSSTITNTANVLIVSPKAQRSRSKERGDKEERKKRKKDSSDAPIVPSDPQNSSPDSRTAFPLTRSPTIAPVPATELPLLNTPFYTLESQVTALTPNITVLKRQRSKEKVQRNRRRKTAILPSSQYFLFSHSHPENVNHVLTTPHILVAQNGPVSTAALQDTEAQNEWRLFTTASPSVRINLHVRLSKQQKKSTLKQNEPETLPIWSVKVRSPKLWMTTSAVPSMSPFQFSIERAREQFNRKKKRKALRLSPK